MRGIYIHIPFCVKKCAYCDFVSENAGGEYIDRYFKSLDEEINSFKSDDMRVDSVFFGGGTPSFVNQKYITAVLDNIRRKFYITENCEISIECNPCSVTEEKAADYKLAGINRISMGMQSDNNEILKILGRSHDNGMFLRAFDTVKKYFENINVDLMYAVSGQTLKSFENTVNNIIKLNVPHISGYALKIEENTPFGKMKAEGRLKPADEDIDREMYHAMSQILQDSGYIHYEISNFALPGYECMHNLKYWQCKEYFGFGVAAHSYADGVRYKNTDNIDEYINKNHRYINIYTLDDYDRKEEYIMLRTRLKEGINFKNYNELFNEDFLSVFGKGIKKLLAAGLITQDDNGIYPTVKGFDLQNALALELIECILK